MRTVGVEGPRDSVWTFDVPTSRRERVRGLRDHRMLPPRRGMLFLRCRSVHTFGMRFAIAVVSLDDELTVRGIHTLGPRRLLLPRVRTRHVMECSPGSPIEIGDRFRPKGEDWSEV